MYYLLCKSDTIVSRLHPNQRRIASVRLSLSDDLGICPLQSSFPTVVAELVQIPNSSKRQQQHKLSPKNHQPRMNESHIDTDCHFRPRTDGRRGPQTGTLWLCVLLTTSLCFFSLLEGDFWLLLHHNINNHQRVVPVVVVVVFVPPAVSFQQPHTKTIP